MEPNNFYIDDISSVIRLMKNTFGDYFKQYYEGDPARIPRANYPCMIVEKVVSQISAGMTGTDDVTSQVDIRLILFKPDDYGKTDEYDSTERRLRWLIEGRDPDTGYFKDNSVLGALRRNITLGNIVIDSDISVEYDINPRAGDTPDETVITSEGMVTITFTERVFINNRQ